MHIVIRNQVTGEFVAFAKTRPVSEWPDARKFDTWGEASDVCQEWGDEWQVEEC